MEIKDLNIVDNNLLEDEVVETLKSVIDNILKDEKSEIKRKSLIRIFQQKIESKTITNDGIWYEIYHTLNKEAIVEESIDMRTIEKVETGIDLLSFTKDNKILFSEMKSSVAVDQETDNSLFSKGVLSQFTKMSKDIAQFGEFIDELYDRELLDDKYREDILKLISSDNYNVGFAGKILEKSILDDIVNFEVLLATSKVKEFKIFVKEIEKSYSYNYSRNDKCNKGLKIDKDHCVNCIDLMCVENILKKLKSYKVTRNKLSEDFNLIYIYEKCIKYINGMEL